MATISITREELMGMMLKAKAKADAEDARTKAKHQKDEQAALKRFRVKLQDAMKWTYEEAKKKRYNELQIDSPSCPTRKATKIEIAIRQLEADSRKSKFNLNDKSDWYEAAFWLPASERPQNSICDDENP